MPPDFTKFEAKVRGEWMDPNTAAAWRRWHGKSVRFWRELTDGIIRAARLERGQRVLDLASGTGDPAIAIGERVGPEGHVVVTDIAPQMVEIARENAAKSGAGNFSFEVVDAHAMPFADASFDRVTCRLGVMFFWDCRRALSEIRRVLKAGGSAAFVAWGSTESNEYIHAALSPFKKRREPPKPPPGAPTPYRFAEPGSLSAELRAAGFSPVQEETQIMRLDWPGPPDELWRRLYEVSAPLRPYFDSFEPEVRATAINEAIANLGAFYDGTVVSTKSAMVVASASR